jgi:hypothetical protein
MCRVRITSSVTAAKRSGLFTLSNSRPRTPWLSFLSKTVQVFSVALVSTRRSPGKISKL